MKRARVWIGIGVLALLGAGIGVLYARDPLFWKRYLLAAIFPATALPEAFYEPSMLLPGGNDPEPPRVRPEEERIDPEALKAAADYAAQHESTALIVGRHGHIVFEKYWDGGNFATVIDSGGFTGTLAALAVGLAMNDRKIGLIEEPAANYLPAFRDASRESITIGDLLHGASGLERSVPGWAPWSQAARERFAGNLSAACLTRAVAARPGERWEPQGCDVQLVAQLVEAATGQGFARYIGENLWKPIGAADARLVRDNEAGLPRADCCLRARRGDWLRVAELLMSEGRFQGEEVVQPGWVRTLLAPSKANPAFAAQIWRGRPFTAGAPGAPAEPYAAEDTYHLEGAGNSRLWFAPSLALVILHTGTGSAGDAQWDDARIPNLIVRGMRDFVAPAASGTDDLRQLVPNH